MNGAVKRKDNVTVKTGVANRKVADKGLLNINEDIAESVGLLLWRKSTALWYVRCVRQSKWV